MNWVFYYLNFAFPSYVSYPAEFPFFFATTPFNTTVTYRTIYL